eukprot:SAG22_NODE_6330_length_869_cov_1.597403_2_plen_40_part_01
MVAAFGGMMGIAVGGACVAGNGDVHAAAKEMLGLGSGAGG